MIEIRSKIRKERSERGLSQEAFAALAGLHRNYLGGVERCERNVGIDNIDAIATALGISICELFEITPP